MWICCRYHGRRITKNGNLFCIKKEVDHFFDDTTSFKFRSKLLLEIFFHLLKEAFVILSWLRFEIR
jgi:hypothetical protein